MKNAEKLLITLRAATPSDYERCMSVDHSCSTDYVWQILLNDDEEGQHITFRQSRLPRSMKVRYPRDEDQLLQSWRLHSFFLVAEWEGQVVGYANAREEASQETAWVADLVVDRPARLQGVGTALLRGVRQWAVLRDLRRLIIETQTKNVPAISFLKKRGLVFCGYNDLFYPNQDIAIFFGQSLH